MAMTTITVKAGQKPTKEQIKRIRAAAKAPFCSLCLIGIFSRNIVALALVIFLIGVCSIGCRTPKANTLIPSTTVGHIMPSNALSSSKNNEDYLIVTNFEEEKYRNGIIEIDQRQEEPPVYDADWLVNEFNKNTIIANELYANTRIRIRGQIGYIYDYGNYSESYYSSIGKRHGVGVYFTGSEREKLMELSLDDIVVIEGICQEVKYSVVNIKYAIFVEYNPSPITNIEDIIIKNINNEIFLYDAKILNELYVKNNMRINHYLVGKTIQIRGPLQDFEYEDGKAYLIIGDNGWGDAKVQILDSEKQKTANLKRGQIIVLQGDFFYASTYAFFQLRNAIIF
jgi:hypothetical protein